MIPAAFIVMFAFVRYAVNEGGAAIGKANKCAVSVEVVHGTNLNNDVL